MVKLCHCPWSSARSVSNSKAGEVPAQKQESRKPRRALTTPLLTPLDFPENESSLLSTVRSWTRKVDEMPAQSLYHEPNTYLHLHLHLHPHLHLHIYACSPQLPFNRPQIPSKNNHTALNRGTLGGSRYISL